MIKNIPISLQYQPQIDLACKNLTDLDLNYTIVHIIFNDLSCITLSNIYQLFISSPMEIAFRKGLNFIFKKIRKRDRYLCNDSELVTNELKHLLEEKFGIYQAYYIVRPCSECTFIFGALKNKKIHNFEEVYQNTIKDFEKFCLDFMDVFSDVVRENQVSYKNSIILTNKKLRHLVISGGYPKNQWLTAREKECLKLISTGKTTKEVAKILFLSPFTIETHTKHIRKKLNCSTMIEAVVEAVNRGIF